MNIRISGGKDRDVTVLSNLFIDHFMPRMNGTSIKVYLYLLRRLSGSSSAAAGLPELSVATMANQFGDTEGDILRAVSYLETEGLLRVSRAEDGAITALHINDPAMLPVSAASQPTSTYGADCSNTSNGQAGYATSGTQTAAPSVPSFMVSGTASDTSSATEPARTTRIRPELPTYTSTQIRELTSNAEVRWIMTVAEKYLERLLNPSDVQLIVYLYESVGFSAELILYLYEYCASRDKKKPAYIETVAISWAEQGIHTVEEAEAATAKYNANYQAVSKAFGLNRMPGTAEQQYIDRWIHQFGFTQEMVTEACSRSLLSTGRPDFKYADKILENWHKKNITGKQELAKADQLHLQNAAKSNHATAKASANNRFNAFPQRNYSSEDYASMERQLAKRQG